MTVEQLKRALQNAANDLEVIVLDGDNAEEYKVTSCTVTLEEYLEHYPEVKPQFIIGI